MYVFFPVVGSDNSLLAVVNVTLQSAAYLTTQTGKRGTPPVWFSLNRMTYTWLKLDFFFSVLVQIMPP